MDVSRLSQRLCISSVALLDIWFEILDVIAERGDVMRTIGVYLGLIEKQKIHIFETARIAQPQNVAIRTWA